MSDIKLCIDRIEDGIAVCEDSDGNKHKLPASSLPDGVKEGDCIVISDDKSVIIDHDETARRRAEIAALQNSIFSE